MKHRRHQNRRRYREKRRDDKRLSMAAMIGLSAFGGLFVGALYLGFRDDPMRQTKLDATSAPQSVMAVGPWRQVSQHNGDPADLTATYLFKRCGDHRYTCVVDGDTFWHKGIKIRIADIDTPEVSKPKCPQEYTLGVKATDRLMALLNTGPIELRSLPDRDEDRFGRKLRMVMRDGKSIGETLIQEGLAHRWVGHKLPWC